MATPAFWAVLGIEPTRDTGVIRRAYANGLKTRRPETDAAAFQELVQARDAAMAFARLPAPKPEPEAPAPSVPEEAPELSLALSSLAEVVADPTASDSTASDPAVVVEEPPAGEPELEAEQLALPLILDRPIQLSPNLFRVVFDRPVAPPDPSPAEQLWGQLRDLLQDGISLDALRWQALIDGVAQLSLADSQRFRDRIARMFLARLPATPAAAGENAWPLKILLSRLGDAFGWLTDQTHLVRVVGTPIALKVSVWSDAIRLDEQLRAREQDIREGRRPAYDANKLPVIDEIDAEIVLSEPGVLAYYRNCRRQGKWLNSPPLSWRYLLAPSLALAEARQGWAVVLLLDFYGLITVVAPSQATLVVVLLVHIMIRSVALRLKIGRAATSVHKADKMRLADPEARRAFLLKKGPVSFGTGSRFRRPRVWETILMTVNIVALIAVLLSAAAHNAHTMS